METCKHFDIWLDGNQYEDCDCENFHSRIGLLHGYMKSFTKLDLQQIREEAIVEVLHQKQMNVNHIEHVLDWDMIPKIDGWISNTRQSLVFQVEAFNSIKGFKVNRQTGDIDFALKKGDPLISLEDIKYLINGGFNWVFFSLDSPDYAKMPYHPFQQFRFGPKHLEFGDILQTLFHTDYLLKFFTQGVDIQFQVPFKIRPIQDNLLNRLPKHLQHIVRSTDKRDQQKTEKIRNTRYWIECQNVELEDHTTEQAFSYLFGDTKMIVKYHPMSLQGQELHDDPSLIQEMSPEADFARDFTQYYDQIALWFPEFNRLKEISKILLMIEKLYDIHKSMIEDAQACQNQTQRNDKITAANKLASYLGVEKSVTITDQSRLWIPAAFQKFIYPYSSRLTYGGVSLSPVATIIPRNQYNQNFSQYECRGLNDIKRLLNYQGQSAERYNYLAQLPTVQTVYDFAKYSNHQRINYLVENLITRYETQNAPLQTQQTAALSDLHQSFTRDFLDQLEEYKDKGLKTIAPNLAEFVEKYSDRGPPDVNQIKYSSQIRYFHQQPCYHKDSVRKKMQKMYAKLNQFQPRDFLAKIDKCLQQYSQHKNPGQMNVKDPKPEIQKIVAPNQPVQNTNGKTPQTSQLQKHEHDYKRMCTEVDISVIDYFEESNPKKRTILEVPHKKGPDGNLIPLGKSGVTLDGVDFGQLDPSDAVPQRIKAVSVELYEKCAPYFQKTKHEAMEFLKAHPTHFTEQEAFTIKQINQTYHHNELKKAIDKAFVTDNHGLKSHQIPIRVMTGLLSVKYQYGNINKLLKLLPQCNGDLQLWYEKCAQLVENPKSQYKTRDRNVARLLKNEPIKK